MLAAASAGSHTSRGLTFMITSIFNGNRRKDVWLDK